MSLRDFMQLVDSAGYFQPGKNTDTSKQAPYQEYLKKKEEAKKSNLKIGLDRGMSFEDISSQAGIDVNEVRQYAEKTRPGYGIGDQRGGISKAIDQLNPLDSGRDWKREKPSSAGAQKSTTKQISDVGTTLFGGVEKTGDALDALTGHVERRQAEREKILNDTWQNVSEKLKDDPRKLAEAKSKLNEIRRQALESDLADTAWAGTQDKGTIDRIKKSAGVSLQATSEIAPFLKGAQAAQLTMKGGALIGGAVGLAHGTGEELINPEGFDWKNVAFQTAIGAGTGGALGKVSEFSSSLNQAKSFLKQQQVSRILETIDNGPQAIQPIEDTSRLLSATTTSAKQQISSRIDEIGSQLNDIRTGKAVNTTFEPNIPSTAKNNLGTSKVNVGTPKTSGKAFTGEDMANRWQKLGVEGDNSDYDALQLLREDKSPYRLREVKIKDIIERDVANGREITNPNIKPPRGAASEPPIINSDGVADGVHRIAEAYKKNPEGTIKAYVSDSFMPTSTKAVSEAGSTPISTKGQQLRALVKERQALKLQLAAIERGDGPLARVSQLNDEILKSVETGKGNVDDLLSEQRTVLESVKANPSITAQRNADWMKENVDTALKNQAALDPSVPSPSNKVPKAAQRLSEATGVPTNASYTTLSDEAQETVYRALKTDSPDTLRQIARGDIDGREFGLTNEWAASRVADDAIKAGDAKTVMELANGKVFTEASRKGQEISSLRALQTDTPVRAIKDINKARKIALAEAGKNSTISQELTETEVNQILVRSNARDRIKEKYLDEVASRGAPTESTRLKYGQSVVEFKKYIEDLKPGASISSIVKHPIKAAIDLAGTSKSLRASLDLSATLRQGAKLLGSMKYKTWAKATLRSIKAAVKELGGESAMDAHLADIYSRPNFVNGLYKKMGIAVGDVVEEAFPSKAIGKIPVLKRLYAASDSAYTIFSQSARADLADDMIAKAVKSGVDITKEGKSIGAMVNALTGRGNLGKLEGSGANALNNVFFSPRLVKSNFDVLGGHILTGAGESFKFSLKKSDNFVRKEASKNLLKMAATAYGVLKVAESVRPNSVEWDQRSSNYGKIKIGNTRFDITGGMSSLITLGARLSKGSTKSSTTDNVTRLDDPEAFNGQTTLGVLGSFAENKLSPALAALVDYVKKEDFTGKKPTAGSTLRNLTVPIIVDNYEELSKDPHAAPLVASLILEGLGVGTNTYDSTDDWTVKTDKGRNKELMAFRKAAGDTKFKAANDIYNQRFTDWFREIRYTDQYKKLSSEGRTSMLKGNREALKEQVFKEFGFKYQTPKRQKSSEQGLIDSLSRFKK